MCMKYIQSIKDVYYTILKKNVLYVQNQYTALIKLYSFNAPSQIYPKLTSRENVGSYVDIDLFDSIFKVLKTFYCQGFKNFSIPKNFLGKKHL